MRDDSSRCNLVTCLFHPMARASTSNRVRIIGGEWRSRLIEFPDAEGLRPTPDRVRETLFNWLGQDLTGLRCLDLYAGAGALGFEALSRHAAHVTMIESSAPVHKALGANAERLGTGTRLRLHKGDALEFLRADSGQYDLVFLDPPYGSGLLARTWPILKLRLAANAWVYAENDNALNFDPDWVVRKSGRAGSVHYYLLEQRTDEHE